MKENIENWDNIYSDGGSFLEFPNEALVVTYHRIKRTLPEKIVCLDYGFGSGNNTQFLINRVNEIYGIEISSQAKDLVKLRLKDNIKFNKNNFIITNTFNPEFENKFDLIVAWHVISYNTHESIEDSIKNLYKYLKKGGVLITTLATSRDISKKYSDFISHNTYRINKGIPSQENCIVTIPKDELDFEDYFKEFETIDIGYEERVSYKKDDLHSHYYGVFKKI